MLKVTSKILIFIPAAAIAACATLYLGRAQPFVKELKIFFFGDVALSNTLKQYHAKLIPSSLVKFGAVSNSTKLQVTWAFRPEYAVAYYPVPVTDDVDHDGRPEVYISSHSRFIYCLDGKTGSIAWKWKLPFAVVGGMVLNLVDLDGDGQKELIFGTHTSLPIRIYALRTGQNPPKGRIMWIKNVNGDFFEGGITVVDKNDNNPLIVAATRDAPYSRGTYYVLDKYGREIHAPLEGFDNCNSKPAIGFLPGHKTLVAVHGSHNFYKAKYGFSITANDLITGKIIWVSSKLGDTGYQNHAIADLDFDGKNEVFAYIGGASHSQKQYILNDANGKILRQVSWALQGTLKKRQQLLVSKGDASYLLKKKWECYLPDT